jgi:FADH2 O2-dependent halogenase
MYSLRFDHGTTSAGFLLTPPGLASLTKSGPTNADNLWALLVAGYPTVASLFANATPVMPVAFRPLIQHRLTRAAGERWALLPHAFAFVDPLFSTGIAWGLRAVERLALSFETAKRGVRRPSAADSSRYESQLAAEADQIDVLVAGAYEAMCHFDLFAAQAMLYFATVSFAEVSQRLHGVDDAGWSGFLGVGDPALESVARESLTRLEAITRSRSATGTADERHRFAEWIRQVVAPRNVAGVADPQRNNLYPVDFDVLIERHELLGMTRDQLVAALPSLRGMSPEPAFGAVRGAGPATSPAGQPFPAPEAPAPR